MRLERRYAGYTYSYPHKTAYRAFARPMPLRELWANENREALFLYLHVPFCEMRCGFCNLFTMSNPDGDLEMRYLDALERQARETAEAIAPARFARMAIGGGTPTFLSERGLERLFAMAEETFGVDATRIPASVETSPETATREKLQLLREHGVERVSIGVQSFVDAEVHAVGRAQRRASVETALMRIRESGAPVLNVDLMYGLPGQTARTWSESLDAALRYAPEELYLYPLYVREATGIAPRFVMGGDARPSLYRMAVERLLDAGYEQVSMRMFRRHVADAANAPVYCCQSDGMVGLGCGARSYTRRVHYSFEWAVGRPTIRDIIQRYIARDSFADAEYGIVLDDEEQRRRWVVQSLLQKEGLDRTAYRARFASEVLDDFAMLRELNGFLAIDEQKIVPTEAGLEWSDALGPALYSARTNELMEAYELR